MAGYMPESSRLSLRLQVGVDGEGKAVHRSLSLRNVNAAATADSVSAVTSALGNLLEFPIVKVQKVDTDMVAE